MISKQSINNFLSNIFVWTILHYNGVVKHIYWSLLYGVFFVNMVTFCYLKANSDQTDLSLPSELPITVFISIVIVGIRQVLLVVSGLPVIILLSLTTNLVLDMIVWISALIVAWMITGYDDFDTMETAMVAFNALQVGLLLNTSARFDEALYEKVNPEEDEEDDGEEDASINILRIKQVIEKSEISPEDKTKIIQCLRNCDRNENDTFNPTQFLRFLYQVAPIILYGKYCSTSVQQKQKYNILQSHLQFEFLCNDPDDESEEEEFDDNADEVVSVVISACKLLGHSQMKWVLLFIIDLLISCTMKSAFDLVAGMGVNAAQDVALAKEGSNQKFRVILLSLGVIFLVNEITYYILGYLTSKLTANGIARVQRDLTDAVLYTGQYFEKKYRQGTLSNLFNAGMENLDSAWDHILFDLALSISTLISALVFMSLIDVGYAIFVLASIPFLTSLRSIEIKAVDASFRSDNARARLFSRFQNILSIRTAAKVANSQAFVAEKLQKNAIDADKSATFWANIWGNLVISIYSTAVYALVLVTTILFLIALSKGEITAGEFFSLVVFIEGTTQPVEDFGRFFGEIANLSGAIYKLEKVLDDAKMDDQHPDEYAKNVKVTLDDELVLDKISLSYTPNGPDILRDISAVIPSGSYVAVVGSSGSGKSTLLLVLMGANRPNKGDIYFDDKPLSKIPLYSLRNSLGVVFQDIFVFDGTIRDNIAFGYNASMEDIIEASKDAGIHDFIQTLPDQYETILGKESTIGLSGGQMQRICGIARALVRKPKLLILDEATSSLDAVTEGYFIETIEQLRDRGMTIISITHRVYTAIKADLILVFDNGSIVESGRYDELITKGENSIFWCLANAKRTTHSTPLFDAEETSSCSDDTFFL